MKKKIIISGMSCPACEGKVRSALEKIESVSHVDVSAKDGYAVVETGCGNEVLVEVLGEAGYDVITIEPEALSTPGKGMDRVCRN
ncbi:MAG: heavy-metal-associated domain-containing protein [Spirochaetaceae bacterium]|jgi:copper chaperone CopZ|nr:heavy-metal-associated domain-containing protein [Spirochaetaceae bacterium]